ncbi:hypothetical protein MSAN_00333700 [Mycena sanguinolenta]|uniref:Uncharacterized protein n=1 Tax=Mycena sanguinolenta TaxID=230812 RepID=A0A8H6ZBD2_9AGAR|nr:hypothetical protein MSAN_00333700 [Mycena sanguinolenta]
MGSGSSRIGFHGGVGGGGGRGGMQGGDGGPGQGISFGNTHLVINTSPNPGSPAPSQAEAANSQSSASGTPDNPAIHPETQTYYNEMLRQGRGLPLFDPEPQLNTPAEWQTEGAAIGDVGQVTLDGSFDFLFNIYLDADDPINAHGVPEGFEPLPRENAFEVKHVNFKGGSFVGSHTVTLDGVDDGQEFPGPRFDFGCQQSTGAVLALPHGAHQEKLLNLRRMEEYAAKHAKSWYKYANVTRGRGLVNGDLYLITGWEKAKSWGMAWFRDVSLQSEFKLSFGPTADAANGYKYRWSGRRYRYKQADSPLDDETLLNHTTFIHTFAISVNERVWEELFGVKVCEGSDSSNVPDKSNGCSGLHQSQRSSSWWSIFTGGSAQNNAGRSFVPSFLWSFFTGGSAQNIVGHSFVPSFLWSFFTGGHSYTEGKQTTASVPGDGIVTDAFPILQVTHPSQIIHQRILREVPKVNVVITHDDAWRDVFKEDGTRMTGQTVPELQQAIFDRFEIVEEDG